MSVHQTLAAAARTFVAIAALVASATCFGACVHPPPAAAVVPTAQFSGTAALAQATRLLQLPRALGDPQRGRAIDQLAADLRHVGASEVHRFPHTGTDPWTGTEFAMTTLVAHVRPEAPLQFVLGSHFDIRPWAESDPDPRRREQPIPGANDGTSGIAVLLTLAPLLAQQLPAEVGFSLIFFDGEELGRPGSGGYCAGSRALAAAITAGAFPHLARAQFAIVLDMVGQANLQIYRDPRSVEAAPTVVAGLWAQAHAAGYAEFVAAPGPALLDDHVPLIEAGIPAVLVIDYNYPPWHTHADDVHQLSARSLEAVGETLRLYLHGFSRRPSG